jgi:hypothetical protein
MLAKLEKQRRLPVKKQRHSSWSEENVSRSTVVVVVVVVIVARTSSSQPYLFLLFLVPLFCNALPGQHTLTVRRQGNSLGGGEEGREGEFAALFFFWLNLVSWDLKAYKMAKSMFFGGEPGGGGGF